MGFFDAMVHSLTTISTGGFSNYDSSFAFFKSDTILLIAVFFMIIGSLPFLVLVGDIIGIMGGWIIGVTQLDFNSNIYIDRTIEYLEVIDIFQGLVKATVFGFLITIMGCFQGFNCGQGAQGVGRAATNAVVSASILILIFNYIITSTFFGN